MDGNPFEEIEELFERMGREFEGEPFGIAASTPVDVADRGDAFVVTADLPGFGSDAIDVTLADRTLRIAAERDLEAEAAEGDYVRRERRRSSVDRSIRLPDAVDEAGVEASYDDGVLTVTLPKAGGEGTSIEVE